MVYFEIFAGALLLLKSSRP